MSPPLISGLPEWYISLMAILTHLKGTGIGETAWFIIQCGLLGLCVTCLDRGIGRLTGKKSLLGITSYDKSNFALILCLWSLGAMVIGFIGVYIAVLTPSHPSVWAVAVGWPALLTKYMQEKRGSDSTRHDRAPEEPITEADREE